MNNIENILNKNNGLPEFVREYFDYLYKLLKGLDVKAIKSFVKELEKARQKKNTIFFIGNGGSASTASHMMNDFGIGIGKRTRTKLPLRVLSLTDNAAVMLAAANDEGLENLFLTQLKIHYKSGDKLVAISASGNSPNIITAAKWVRKQGGVVMSLVGFDGGQLKEISDVVIHVKSMNGEYGPVEDIHLILDHVLSYWIEYRIKKTERK